MTRIIRTLAIETSCDDTSVAVVSFDGKYFAVEKMLAYSQLEIHEQYGGVVPELAARSHMQKILPLVEALGGEELREQIDSISVTAYPGLPGALVVGVTAAHTLGALWEKPVVDVHHIMGHVFSVLADRGLSTMQLPYLCLTVSGGHNDVYLVDRRGDAPGGVEEDVWHKQHHVPLGGSLTFGPYTITKCAQTMDDAAGEVFDKVARMLGGPYPGGKRVGEQAVACPVEVQGRFTFTKPAMPDDQFSLSGLKSQVHNVVHKLGDQIGAEEVQAICYAFQETIVDTLVEKFGTLVEQYQPATVGLVGGVSASTRLREVLGQRLDNSIITPEKFVYCTDNAGMIGVVGLVMHDDFDGI